MSCWRCFTKNYVIVTAVAFIALGCALLGLIIYEAIVQQYLIIISDYSAIILGVAGGIAGLFIIFGIIGIIGIL